MEIRSFEKRVISVGNSFAVVIPIEFVKRLKLLSKGDLVKVSLEKLEELSNNEQPEKAKELKGEKITEAEPVKLESL